MKKKRNKKIQKVSPLGDLLKRYKGEKPPKSFWGGISPKMVGFVFGLAKSGKTIICENLALSITSGRDKFLGIPIEIPNSKVLFISMEENVGIRIIQRGNKQIKGYSSEEKENIKKNLYYSDEEFIRSVENTQDWVLIEDEIKKYRPNVVFIDSTNRFNIDIESRDETNKMMQKIRKFADKFECAIILIHHTNKAQKNKSISEAQMSGSSALARDADFFIGINSLTNGTRYLKFITNRYSQTREMCIVFSIQKNYLIDFETEEHESVLIKSLDGRYDVNNTEKIVKFIKENIDRKNMIETKTLYSHFVVENGLISKKTLYNQLKKLIEMNQLKKAGHGKYKLLT
ncbi:AAA family ATPase [Tenacibaculum mesophilum]|uniref:AAA family ATPase n=1 Tax=Tenacibaculum mesophilum TaxID=104268 RepID=UPI00248F9CEB|nr:AAA family ATPase [Tenacibaculum mesophilum]